MKHLRNDGWIEDKQNTYTSYTLGEWQIIRYSRTDWSVYQKDIDDVFQYQITFKTMYEAKMHCC